MGIIMKKELDYFNIGSSYGGNQEWFSDFMMRVGGCAAETACECCIYFDLRKGTNLYPFDKNRLSKSDFAEFGKIIKPYLHPRIQGINKLDLYIEGFSRYLKDRSSSIVLSKIGGEESVKTAKQCLKKQIDREIPVPFLCLNHTNRRFREYEWHWFIINGYEEFEETLRIKAVTYSSWEWLSFDELWNTGYKNKGGLVIISIKE